MNDENHLSDLDHLAGRNRERRPGDGRTTGDARPVLTAGVFDARHTTEMQHGMLTRDGRMIDADVA